MAYTSNRYSKPYGPLSGKKPSKPKPSKPVKSGKLPVVDPAKYGPPNKPKGAPLPLAGVGPSKKPPKKYGNLPLAGKGKPYAPLASGKPYTGPTEADPINVGNIKRVKNSDELNKRIHRMRVKRQNAKTSTSSTGTRSSSSSTRSTSSSTSSGGGSGTGTKTSVGTRGRPPGRSQGARDRNRNAAAEGRQTGAATAAAVKPDPIGELYGAARRQLDDEQRRMDVIRQQRISDMAKFDDYMRQARESSSTTLRQQFADSAQQANAARQASTTSVDQYLTAAKAAVGGPVSNSATAAQGQSAALAQQGTLAQTNAVTQNQDTLAARNVSRGAEDIARSGELRSGVDNRYQNFLDSVSKQRFNLDLEEKKSRIDQGNKDRQYDLDRQAADFLNQYKMAQLGIAQNDSKTKMFTAQASAAYQQNLLKLRNGELSLKQALGQVNADLKARGLNIQERRVKLAEFEAAAKRQKVNTKGAVDAVRKYQTDMLASTFGGATWDRVDDHGKSETIRGAITKLAMDYPGMTWQQATQAMASVFGGDKMKSNPQYRKMIQQRFK